MDAVLTVRLFKQMGRRLGRIAVLPFTRSAPRAISLRDLSDHLCRDIGAPCERFLPEQVSFRGDKVRSFDTWWLA